MFNYISLGGWVMYAILFTSIIAATIIIERTVCFIRTGISYEQISRSITGSFSYNSLNRIRNTIKKTNHLSVIIDIFLQNPAKNKDEIEELINKEGTRVIRKMEAPLSVLTTVSVLAPLMGLLGTVLGMIVSFQQIHQLGAAADASDMAGGIWEALLTTAFGLIVAIIVTGINHFFGNIIDKRQNEMNYLITDLYSAFGMLK